MKRSLNRASGIILLTILWLAAAACSEQSRQGVETREGVIEGALYTLARPANWNGKVLVFAHGLRPEADPLRADLDTSRPLYSTLLDEGWLIATTSYRRNGIIVEDAIVDLDLLRRHIAETDGSPERVIVMGDSMGGLIGTLIAESEQHEFDAILAAGAAVAEEQLGGRVSFTYEPNIPILFLTNRSELQGPAEYVQQAAGAGVPPALWRVDRDGHVNVSDDERLAAIRALEHLLDTGELEFDKDATIEQETGSTAEFTGTSATGSIVGVTENHGNIFTSFVPDDLAKLGIEPGDRFVMTAGDITVSVLLGTEYGDVGQGEWIGIQRAEGVLMIARNYANACETLGCSVGHSLTITPVQPKDD